MCDVSDVPEVLVLPTINEQRNLMVWQQYSAQESEIGLEEIELILFDKPLISSK